MVKDFMSLHMIFLNTRYTISFGILNLHLIEHRFNDINKIYNHSSSSLLHSCAPDKFQYTACNALIRAPGESTITSQCGSCSLTWFKSNNSIALFGTTTIESLMHENRISKSSPSWHKITADRSWEHPLKALIPIDVTLLGMVIDVRTLQFAKALSPMDVTLLGMVIDVSALHS